MSNYDKTGGPVFPVIVKLESSQTDAPDYSVHSTDGVSLRDWFAGQALYTAEIKRNVMTIDDLARNAYEIADAMIAERAKTK